MGISGDNPSNSGPQAASNITRVGMDILSGSQYVPSHIRHHRQRVLDVTQNPQRVYKPGNQIKFQFEQRDFNATNSFLEFDLLIHEIPCHDSLATVVGRARKHFRESVRSRPGLSFSQLPAPMGDVEHALFIGEDSYVHLSEATNNNTINTSPYTASNSDWKIPVVNEWDTYITQTNPLSRTFAKHIIPFMEPKLFIDPTITILIGNPDWTQLDDAGTLGTPIQWSENPESMTLIQKFNSESPITALPTQTLATFEPSSFTGSTDMYSSNIDLTIFKEPFIPRYWSALYGEDNSSWQIDSALWTTVGHSLQYQEMAEPGAVLNYRLRAMQMTRGVNEKVFESFVQNDVITPDEALAVWDPYGFAMDTAITKNDAHGLMMRNIFGLFRQIEVGTSSNPSLIETYHNCQDVLLTKSFVFENDTLKLGSSAYWSTSAIPSIFQWQKPTNMRLAFHNQSRAVNGPTSPIYQTSDRPDLSLMDMRDNRQYVGILNPFPFYKPEMVLPISIPLPLISDFFRDEFIPHMHLTQMMMLTLHLNQLGQAFDYAKCDGFSRDTGERVLDTISFGNAANFIRNVLNIPNWGGWELQNVRLNMDYLEFYDNNDNGGLGTQMYLGKYLAMFQQGVQRPYQVYNQERISDTRGESLNTIRKGYVAPSIINLQHTLNDGVLSMIFYYHKLDGCNGAMIPLHDNCALEMGLHQNWRLPAIQNQFYTLDEQQHDLLYLYNKDDTNITNPATDLIMRFGNPMRRFMEMECEYFYHRPKSTEIWEIIEPSGGGASGGVQYTLTNTTFDKRKEHGAMDLTYGFQGRADAGIHNYSTNYSQVAYKGTSLDYPLQGAEFNYFDVDTTNYIGADDTKYAIGTKHSIGEAIPLDQIYTYELTEDGSYFMDKVAATHGITYNTVSTTNMLDRVIPDKPGLTAVREAELFNAYNPYKIYSQSNIFQPKKISYHDTCFGVYDFRGDAPTPGTLPGAVMTGITTGAVLQNTLRMQFNIHDMSIGERFANRNFEHHIIKVMDRVCYYVPEGEKLKLMVETNPSIITPNAV